jgi:hypothetical protein
MFTVIENDSFIHKHILRFETIYRIIRKSLWNFRTRQHNNQDSRKEISIGRHSLQVCVDNRRHGVVAGFSARGQSWWIMMRTGDKKTSSVLDFAKTESTVTVQWRFWTKYHTEPPMDKTTVSGTRNFSRVAACPLWNEQASRGNWPKLSNVREKLLSGALRRNTSHELGIADASVKCWLLRAPDKSFSHMLDSLGWWPWLGCSFCSAQAATLLEFLVPLTNCFVRRWLCVVLGPKPPLHCHNWLLFGKFQDTERFLIPCPRHVSSWLAPSSETCKYTMAPIIHTNLERFSTYWYAPFCCVCLGCCTEFGSSGGIYELPCISS